MFLIKVFQALYWSATCMSEVPPPSLRKDQNQGFKIVTKKQVLSRGTFLKLFSLTSWLQNFKFFFFLKCLGFTAEHSSAKIKILFLLWRLYCFPGLLKTCYFCVFMVLLFIYTHTQKTTIPVYTGDFKFLFQLCEFN